MGSGIDKRPNGSIFCQMVELSVVKGINWVVLYLGKRDIHSVMVVDIRSLYSGRGGRQKS